MKTTLNDKLIAWLALFSGLSISAVAIYYSVAGLVSIFAAAAIPIIVMGVVLEVGKLSATIWLKHNWSIAPRFLKTYLLIAIAILMLVTSMGIFGFLSKAHSDAGLVSGDVQAKIAIYDEKIKTERENIDAARKALTQMDAQVNERLSRSTDDRGAERAVQIRRQQQAERARLQNDISRSQSAIAKLNEERAPIAAEVRKVEAEVGPIKYIANFIYGDNPDANILEKAVTWVIIIIVSVFDPLAVILLLASQYSFQWFRRARDDEEQAVPVHVDQPELIKEPEIERDLVAEGNAAIAEIEPEPVYESVSIPCVKCGKPLTEVPGIGFVCANLECDPPVQEAEEDEEHDEDREILEEASTSEAAAMTAWKRDNPDSSLKIQRRLLQRGLIDRLPWEESLEPKADFDDEAAIEASRWAQEQLDKSEAAKKKGNDLDGERRQDASEENQGIVGYVQNAEQSEQTIWQRVQQVKK